MRFKLDENLPADLAELLRSAGHDAMTVYEQSLGGEPDAKVIAACRHEGRALITLDLDFSDTRTYPPQEHAGIIVLRLRKQDKVTVFRTTSDLINVLEHEQVSGRLMIVEEDRIRIRGEDS